MARYRMTTENIHKVPKSPGIYKLYKYFAENVDFDDRMTMFVDKDKMFDVIRRWGKANDVDMERIPSSKTGLTQTLDKYEVYSKRIRNSEGVQVVVYAIPGMWKQGSRFTVERIRQNTEQTQIEY